MRAIRLALAATVIVAGLPAVADAAKKKPAPVCLQVVDAQGDAKVGAADAPSLDIVSGDIATGKRNLVVALRMKSLARDPFLPGGATYIWSWTVNGARQAVDYYVYGTGEVQGFYRPTGIAGSSIPVQAVADAATSTITWTVPRKLVAPLKKPGAKLSGFDLSARAAANFRLPDNRHSRGFIGSVGDTASSTKVYTDNAPTCLKGT